MSNIKTGIEWCDATWNPVTGCEKVSQGCKNCYAERVFDRMAANPKAPMYHGRKFTDVVCHPERLGEPLRWKKPRRVFVNSMSDLFHEAVPFEFIVDVLAVMVGAVQHDFIVLTKRPERMREVMECVMRTDNLWEAVQERRGWDFIGFHPAAESRPIPNLILGVSVEDQATADERIPILLQTPAKVRFVSYEPALGPVDLTDLDGCDVLSSANDKFWDGSNLRPGHLDWVIAGGESGPNARPSHPDWFRAVRDQCKAAGVPFHFKQWGRYAPIDWRHTRLKRGDRFVWPDGGSVPFTGGFPAACPGQWQVMRPTRKDGRDTLDGVEHNEFPEVRR